MIHGNHLWHWQWLSGWLRLEPHPPHPADRADSSCCAERRRRGRPARGALAAPPTAPAPLYARQLPPLPHAFSRSRQLRIR